MVVILVGVCFRATYDCVSHAGKQYYNNTVRRINRQNLCFIALSQTARQFHFLCNFLPVTEEESDPFKTMLETTHNLRQSIKVSCIVSDMSVRSNRMRTATHSMSAAQP